MQVNLTGTEDDSGRRMGIFGASASNMLNMIGVGPFLSIPLILVAVHGSKVLFAWILGAAISLCHATSLIPQAVMIDTLSVCGAKDSGNIN